MRQNFYQRILNIFNVLLVCSILINKCIVLLIHKFYYHGNLVITSDLDERKAVVFKEVGSEVIKGNGGRQALRPGLLRKQHEQCARELKTREKYNSLIRSHEV